MPVYRTSTAASETTNEVRFHVGTEVSDKLSLDASWYFTQGTYHVPNPSVSAPIGSYVNLIFPYSAPRVSAVWRPSRDIAIRAATGGGFALPQLYSLIGSNGAPSCSGGICTVNILNTNLTPEKSFGIDLGTDIRLHGNNVLSFDVYRTNLFGQFFSSSTLTGTFGGDPLYTTQNGNLSQSRYEGINLSVRHEVTRGTYWNGTLGLTRGYVVSVPAGLYNKAGVVCTPATPSNCRNQYVIPGINFNGQFVCAVVPYATATAQFGYRWNAGRYADVLATYYGNNNSYFRPAFVEIDAHAGYALTKDVSLLATFRNITGIYDQGIQFRSPTALLAAPAIKSLFPNPVNSLPYGPRTVIVTLNWR